MATDSDWPPATTILAFAALVAVVGVALYFVLPVVGATVGLCIAVSTTGLATAGAVGAWVAPIASASVATIGVTLAVVVIKKVSDSAKERPFEWGLPLLAAAAGFMSTLAKDTGLESNVSKWLFGGITSLLIVVAGACYKRQTFAWKSVAAALFLLPPIVLLTLSTLSSNQPSVLASFNDVSTSTWINLSAILVIGLLVGILAHFDSTRNRKAA
jgi:hypothetical protein